MDADTKNVASSALESRLLVLCLQMMSHLIIPDHEADAFRFAALETRPKSFADVVIQDYALRGLIRWDANYFLAIASKGYTADEMLAFFPLFPLVVKTIGKVVHFLSWYSVDIISSQILAAVSLNVVLFVVSSVSLYKLTLILFNNKNIATRSAQYFAYNPASIFFTACYSESLFSALTFTGLWLLSLNLYLPSALLFGLSSLTRSNGILSLGFICYRLLLNIIWSRSMYKKTIYFASLVASTVVCLLPFAVYQWYSFTQFCASPPRSDQPEWCSSFSLPYSSVQRKYWNLGFLRYYQLKQTPNFILASPVVVIIAWASVEYLVNNKHLIPKLGFSVEVKARRSLTIWTNSCCFPYVVHVLFLSLFGILFIHVQVITRLIFSSTPVIYWISASLPEGQVHSKVLNHYFVTYFLIGIVLHSNFFPWT